MSSEELREDPSAPMAGAAPVSTEDKVRDALSPSDRTDLSLSRGVIWGLGALLMLALASSAMLWNKLSTIQEALARQSAQATEQASQALILARTAQEKSQEVAARVTLFDARLAEVALQRSQLEELIQSLSRSRDENVVVDIESAVRLSQQQAQLTGSVAPLLAALVSANERITRAAQPRMAPLQRAIERDIGRIKATAVSDLPALLIRMDELVRLVDDLPLANAVAAPAKFGVRVAVTEPLPTTWWERVLHVVWREASSLLRVSTIDQPEAALLTPEQSFFVRENLKLKLVNARLGLLARQLESSRADVASAVSVLQKYFDPGARKTQVAAGLLQQVQLQMKTLELPRVDDTLAALSAAAAGR